MNKRELIKLKKGNARLYPIYKMFSWDLLFFYSIEFLFYTITKKVTASEILIINGFYLLFNIIMQIPAVAITDLIGRRKSIILGNLLLAIFLICLMASTCVIHVALAYIIMSFAFFGFGVLRGVGIGTIVCAIFNGYLIGKITEVLEKIFTFENKMQWESFFNKE